MMKKDIKMGAGILAGLLDGLAPYALVTMAEPLALIELRLKKAPRKIILNGDMRLERLEEIERTEASPETEWIVGFGGGTSCDTAKYLSWKWRRPLIVAPSIISVDAWLCRSIAVRVGHKVRYIGDAAAESIIVDTDLLREAPRELNLAGVCDVVSIATALGDWRIARDRFGARFDGGVYDEAKRIADDMIAAAPRIAKLDDDGICALVEGIADEVGLCERWGDARPEEGGEHFLAYCLEEKTHAHYLHGKLVAMNILIVLKLQREHAVYDWRELKRFFDTIGLDYSPGSQNILREELKSALLSVSDYVRDEGLFTCVWSLDGVFDEKGEYSVDGVLDWIYRL